MKKILAIILFATSIYAIPPCELPEQRVCTYFYKGAMSAEIIIVNLLPDTVMIEYAGGMLDWKTKNVSNLKLETGQRHTLLKSVYENYEWKPFYSINSMKYRVIPKISTPQHTIKQTNKEEKKENIKIEMH